MVEKNYGFDWSNKKQQKLGMCFSPSKCYNNYFELYDSLLKESIPFDLIQQIASFSMYDQPEIVISVTEVQQQSNEVKCGVSPFHY